MMSSQLGRSSSIDTAPSAARSTHLTEQFQKVRAQTTYLSGALAVEDCALQSMPDASPVKWHLGHTSWFFETFVLEKALPGYAPFRPEFRRLFNSYYVAVGPRHPRPERGLLSRPTLDEVMEYRRHVDARMAQAFDDGTLLDSDLIDIAELGVHHEQQHQELILTDLKHLFSRNPLRPVYAERASLPAGPAPCSAWILFAEGLIKIGHDGGSFCFDNEQPRHRVFVGAFEIASQPVTNREYLEFIADHGYERPELWLSEGWDVRLAQDWNAPLYWARDHTSWSTFTLNGQQPLRLDEPVCHVSYFEADAFARWAGARLPSETEWETFAGARSVNGNLMESGRYHPAPASHYADDGAAQVFGDVWEWTHSSYEPYPGYQPATGAVGEYNGKFMVNQYVLRGGSCATPGSHIRATYRNFFPAAARWQFSGIRLARDVR